MKYEITTIVTVEFEHIPPDTTSSLSEVSYRVKPGKELDKAYYLDDQELPNANGVKAATAVLVAGIVSNIKWGHHKGFINEIDHVRYVIDKISEGFATNAQLIEGTMKE